MGNWQLEVARMAMYIAFPVVLFHWFNQPENFEDWVIKVRKESFVPEQPGAQEEWKQIIQEFNAKKDLEKLQEMEEAQKKFDALAARNNNM